MVRSGARNQESFQGGIYTKGYRSKAQGDGQSKRDVWETGE